ncbi:D-aminoacyl-tRNA deacylase [Sulfuracidifex tepidarius]|uniref:D-tyrosyl-tRNA(Tyr) deacylase n=1 Tax=Sulfuracidifex tepidarius TaxID=1294262 RepID=A0A510DYL6_9CREN|nr:D-aminoacyl-tRNA deacylase [Sulfuracidifex tepidarius]BBG25333.1 D-aminoacyl-tRNA deacylase [Sulfuracidifex tepidarius]BBG28127.1 D-aminoacyl-tRNA deacylase [Sulfuracidifex tepidarius]
MVEIGISLQDQVGKTVKKLGYSFLELEGDVTEFKYDGNEPLIVLCRHESSSGKPSLTVHYPGNPSEKTMGGRPETLGFSYPSLGTSIYKEIVKIDYEIDKVFEATHHGPTIDIPVVFVEVGSSEEMWKNETLVKSLVEAVLRGIENMKTCEEVVVGLGGPHYAYQFSSITKDSCLGHVISKHYVKSIKDDVIRQSVLRSRDKTTKVIFNDLSQKLRSKIQESLSDLNLIFELI